MMADMYLKDVRKQKILVYWLISKKENPGRLSAAASWCFGSS
jgi:hypothetical protein